MLQQSYTRKSLFHGLRSKKRADVADRISLVYASLVFHKIFVAGRLQHTGINDLLQFEVNDMDFGNNFFLLEEHDNTEPVLRRYSWVVDVLWSSLTFEEPSWKFSYRVVVGKIKHLKIIQRIKKSGARRAFINVTTWQQVTLVIQSAN